MPRLLLPDAMQQRLAQHGYQLSLSARVIGNETELVFQHCRSKDENGKEVLIDTRTDDEISAMTIYHAVADSENVNTSPFSVKDYHYTSRLNVPDDLWNDYHMFGRHHWKAIIPKCKDAKELRKMADIVLSWSDEYGGKLIPVSVLRNKLKGNGEHEFDNDGICIKCKKREEDGPCIPAPAKWEKYLKTAKNACKKLAADEATPQFIQSAAKGFISRTVHPPLP